MAPALRITAVGGVAAMLIGLGAVAVERDRTAPARASAVMRRPTPATNSTWSRIGQRVGSNGVIVGFDPSGGPLVASTDGSPPPAANYPVGLDAFRNVGREGHPSPPRPIADSAWRPGMGRPKSQPVGRDFPPGLDICPGLDMTLVDVIAPGARPCAGGNGHGGAGNTVNAVLVSVVDAPSDAWDYYARFAGSRRLTVDGVDEIVVPSITHVGAVVRARLGSRWTVQMQEGLVGPPPAQVDALEALASKEELWVVKTH